MKKSNCVKFAATSVIILAIVVMIVGLFTGCGEISATESSTQADIKSQISVAGKLARDQKTPTDIDYSLERYNLTRRAYWVNGQREKANTLVCPVEKPLGYIVLMTESGSVVGRFTVDGKVSSLNSFLTPGSIDSIEGDMTVGYTTITTEMADVDGSYGENDAGIFFFTTDSRYIEWTGTYLYSDIPFEVDDPIVKVGEVDE